MRIADARRADGSSPAPTAAAALLVLLLAVLLSGCASTTEPQPTLTPTATDAAPLFASDEEALAAATEAYRAYLEADDRSWQGTPEMVDAFLKLTVGEAHDEDVSIRSQFAENGWTRTGSTSFDSMTLQSHDVNADGLTEIRTYVCLDVSQADVLDSDGTSAAKPDRPLLLPLEVAFLAGTEPENSLQLSESRVWSGPDFC